MFMSRWRGEAYLLYAGEDVRHVHGNDILLPKIELLVHSGFGVSMAQFDRFARFY